MKRLKRLAAVAGVGALEGIETMLAMAGALSLFVLILMLATGGEERAVATVTVMWTTGGLICAELLAAMAHGVAKDRLEGRKS